MKKLKSKRFKNIQIYKFNKIVVFFSRILNSLRDFLPRKPYPDVQLIKMLASMCFAQAGVKNAHFYGLTSYLKLYQHVTVIIIYGMRGS